MSRRTPFPRCAICDRALEELGGKRLVSTPTYSVSVCIPSTLVGLLRHPARIVRLEGDFRDIILAFHGEDLWSDDAVNRAVTPFNQAFDRGFASDARSVTFAQNAALQ